MGPPSCIVYEIPVGDEDIDSKTFPKYIAGPHTVGDLNQLEDAQFTEIRMRPGDVLLRRGSVGFDYSGKREKTFLLLVFTWSDRGSESDKVPSVTQGKEA